jgi:hypothetical protein
VSTSHNGGDYDDDDDDDEGSPLMPLPLIKTVRPFVLVDGE